MELKNTMNEMKNAIETKWNKKSSDKVEQKICEEQVL